MFGVSCLVDIIPMVAATRVAGSGTSSIINNAPQYVVRVPVAGSGGLSHFVINNLLVLLRPLGPIANGA